MILLLLIIPVVAIIVWYRIKKKRDKFTYEIDGNAFYEFILGDIDTGTLWTCRADYIPYVNNGDVVGLPDFEGGTNQYKVVKFVGENINEYGRYITFQVEPY